MMDSYTSQDKTRHQRVNTNSITTSGGIPDKGNTLKTSTALALRGPRKFGTPSVYLNRLNQLKHEVGQIKNKRWQLPKVDNSSPIVSDNDKDNIDMNITPKSQVNPPTTGAPFDPLITPTHISQIQSSQTQRSKRVNQLIPTQFLGRGYMYYTKLNEKDAKINQLQHEIQDLQQLNHDLLVKLTSVEVDLLTAQKDAQKKLEKCDYEWQKRLLRQRERLTAQHNVECSELKTKLAAVRQNADEMRIQFGQLQKEYAIVTTEMEKMSLDRRNLAKDNEIKRSKTIEQSGRVILGGRDEKERVKVVTGEAPMEWMESRMSPEDDTTTSILLLNSATTADEEDTTDLINGIFGMGGASTTEVLIKA